VIIVVLLAELGVDGPRGRHPRYREAEMRIARTRKEAEMPASNRAEPLFVRAHQALALED
jgi:hypothetical protein